jgi:hypothetical protein
MKTLTIAGALASLLPTLALAQGIAPGWECSTDVQGQRTCRSTWPDIRNQAPPQANDEQPRQKKR